MADQPFQAHVEISLPAGTGGQNGFVSVPAGKRLLIEWVSGESFLPTGQKCLFSITTSLAGEPSGKRHYLNSTQMGPFGSQDLARTGQVVALAADGGTSVMLRADRNTATGQGLARMSLAGRLITP